MSNLLWVGVMRPKEGCRRHPSADKIGRDMSALCPKSGRTYKAEPLNSSTQFRDSALIRSGHGGSSLPWLGTCIEPISRAFSREYFRAGFLLFRPPVLQERHTPRSGCSPAQRSRR